MNNQIGPYKRPTSAQVEQALSTLAVEYMFLRQEHVRRPAREWSRGEKEVMVALFPQCWTNWLASAIRKLEFALKRPGVGNVES